jgi:transposase
MPIAPTQNQAPLSKTTNEFSPEVRVRAVRMILDHEGDYPSRWSAVVSVADKSGCGPQTLHDWVKKAEVDSGKRAGVPSETADKLKALEREARELRQANDLPGFGQISNKNALDSVNILRLFGNLSKIEIGDRIGKRWGY